jgi:predicted  nucleic acid-binding Zn-ribbon protein
MAIPVYNVQYTLCEVAEDACMLFSCDTLCEYAICGSQAFASLQESAHPGWKALMNGLVKLDYQPIPSPVNSTIGSLFGSTVISALNSTINPTINSTLNGTMSAATINEEMIQFWIVVISYFLFWLFLLVPTIYLLAPYISTHVSNSQYSCDYEGTYNQLIGPSWFPFGLSYGTLANRQFFAILAVGASRRVMPKNAVTLASDVDPKDTKISALESDLEEREDKINSLSVQLDNAQARIKERDAEAKETSDRIAKKNEEQKTHLLAARDDLMAICTYINEYGIMFRQMREHVNQISAKNELLGMKVEELKDTNDRLELEVDDLIASNEILDTENRNFERANKDLTLSKRDFETTNSELQARIFELDAFKRDLQCRNEDIETENINWQNTMHALHSPAFGPSIQDISFQNLTTQLAELQASHDRILAANQTLKSNLEYVHSTSARNAHLATAKDNELRNAEAKIADLQEELDQINGEVDDITSQLGDVQHENDMLRAEVTDKEKDINRILKEAEHTKLVLRTEINDLQIENEDMNKELSHIVTSPHHTELHLGTKINDLQGEKVELSEDYAHYADATSAKAQSLRAKLSDVEAENDSLHAAFDDQLLELGYLRHNALEAAKYAQWEAWEKREAAERKHMDDIMCAMHERQLELEGWVPHYRNENQEWEDRFVAQERWLEWVDHQIQEGAVYVQWECEGFGEEGFVEVGSMSLMEKRRGGMMRVGMRVLRLFSSPRAKMRLWEILRKSFLKMVGRGLRKSCILLRERRLRATAVRSLTCALILKALLRLW